MGTKWRTLILFVGLAVACAAQSAEAAERSKPSEQYADVMSHFRGPCESDPDGTKFAARACYLDRGFDATNIPYGGDYQRPTCDRSAEVAASRKEILAKAYSLAPNYAKARLCRLTQLFLTKAGDSFGSWGLWEAKDRPPGNGVFIAISDRFLGDVKSLSELETNVTTRLLALPATADLKNAPRFAGGDDSAIVALSVLSHELGHILLAAANVDGTSPEHPRRKVLGPPVSSCFDQAFIARSWDKKGFQQSMRRWVPFADPAKNRAMNAGFELSSLRGNVEAADDALSKVYSREEFVSLWATTAPDEDIPETFRYKVLADAKQAVSIRVPGTEQDIKVRDFVASPAIRKKVDCLRQLKLFSAPR